MIQKVTYQDFGQVEIFSGTLTEHVFPWHSHASLTIILVDEGSMSYLFKHAEIVLKPGEVLIIHPHQAHSNFSPEKFCRYRVLFISQPQTELFLKYTHVEYPSKRSYPILDKVFKQLREDPSPEVVTACMSAVMNTFSDSMKTLMSGLRKDSRIEMAISLIHSRIDSKLTIKHIADYCQLSSFHFQRLFKKEVGVTVKEYIQQTRMEWGKKRLHQGESITTVALDTGYFDQSHFTKQFKKMYASSPFRFNQ